MNRQNVLVAHLSASDGGFNVSSLERKTAILCNTQFENVIVLIIVFFFWSYNENEPVKLFDLRKRRIVARRRTMLFRSRRIFSMTP